MKPLMHRAVLLVEDDPLEARRLESALCGLGAAVTLVADGDAALERMRTGSFDVVLLDLVLPGLDGMGVLRALAREGIATPVVAAVTTSGLDRVREAIRAGARDFVVKPAGAMRLQVALGNAIALAEAAGAHRRDAVVALPGVGARLPGRAEAGYSRLDDDGHVRPIAALEADAIRYACAYYGGRLGEVARRLGIGRSTLYRRVADLGAAALHHDGIAARHPEPAPLRIVAAE